MFKVLGSIQRGGSDLYPLGAMTNINKQVMLTVYLGATIIAGVQGVQ